MLGKPFQSTGITVNLALNLSEQVEIPKNEHVEPFNLLTFKRH